MGERKFKKPRSPNLGGKRPGAGRPKGIIETKPRKDRALRRGEVGAIKATNLRIPVGTSEEDANLAKRALQRVIDVMNGKTGRHSTSVLSAAKTIREEICGPVKQEVGLTAKVGLEQLVLGSFDVKTDKEKE